MAFIGCFVTAILMSGLTVGVKVIYDGKELGILANSDSFEGAKTLAVSAIRGAEADDFDFSNSSLKKILTIKSRFSSENDVAEAIINSSNKIVYATEVSVNGKRTICVDNFDVEQYLEKSLSKYDVEGAKNTHEFIDDVSIKNCYCFTSDLSSVNETVKLLDSLDVKTTSVITSEEEIPYSTVTEKTSMQYVGYSSVITSGVKGVARKTESVVSLNGVQSSSKEIENRIISYPIDEVVLIGTKTRYNASAARLGFVFPVPKGSYVVTSYYGDGRNHKGVDLAADRGVSIFAVKSGTVVYSGSNGNYGYCVIVDHGNGLKTLYAHADKLLVNVGERVSAGQTIATVGNTGRSTGNHLHFEVIVNGNNVDPAPYISLK